MIAALPLPTVLHTAAGDVVLRRAVVRDLEALLLLLSDDAVSAARGDRADPTDPDVLAAHHDALAEIVGDRSNEVVVVVDASGAVVGTLQLTRIPGLARRGSVRLLVQAVRVRSTRRSGGVGTALVRWVCDTAAPAVGASLVQLTSDEVRRDAHRFYERLGFVGSHRGFKFSVDAALSPGERRRPAP